MRIKLVIYFSILFFVSEFVLISVKHSKKGAVKAKNDSKSLLLFWITIPTSLSIGFFAANYNAWGKLNYLVCAAGLCVFLMGLTIRWVSIIQLSKEFTVDVAITKTHKLRTKGIYKKIRHPSYLGLLLICTGLSISMNSILSVAVICIPIILVLGYRIKAEEEILINEFGDTYRAYMKRTCKIFPKLRQ